MAETTTATTNATTKKKRTTRRQTPKQKEARRARPRLVTRHIEYFEIDTALVRGGGTRRTDRISRTSTSRARTDRLRGARVFRTGADQLTIQQADGDELLFNIGALQRIVERTRDLSITHEIPNYN